MDFGLKEVIIGHVSGHWSVLGLAMRLMGVIKVMASSGRLRQAGHCVSSGGSRIWWLGGQWGGHLHDRGGQVLPIAQ